MKKFSLNFLGLVLGMFFFSMSCLKNQSEVLAISGRSYSCSNLLSHLWDFEAMVAHSTLKRPGAWGCQQMAMSLPENGPAKVGPDSPKGEKAIHSQGCSQKNAFQTADTGQTRQT